MYLVNYVAPLTSQVEELENICTIRTSSAQPTMNNHKMPDSHRPSICPYSRSRVQFATQIDTSAHTNTLSELTPTPPPHTPYQEFCPALLEAHQTKACNHQEIHALHQAAVKAWSIKWLHPLSCLQHCVQLQFWNGRRPVYSDNSKIHQSVLRFRRPPNPRL